MPDTAAPEQASSLLRRWHLKLSDNIYGVLAGLGGFALAVPFAGGLAGTGVGVAGLYGATMLARSAIGAVTNVAVDAGTSYLTGNWKSFNLTNVGVDVAVGGLMGVPNPDRLVGTVLASPLVGLPVGAGASEYLNQKIQTGSVNTTTWLKNTATLGIFHF